MAKEAQTIFQNYRSHTIAELEELFNQAKNREECLFYQCLLALKLSLAKDKDSWQKM